jgi:hypothetical protein
LNSVSILELIVDLLDGWHNASGLVSESSDSTIARTLERTLQGVQLPATRGAAEALLLSLPPLSNGTAPPPPESSGTWTHWHSQGEQGPTLGVVDVSHIDPKFDHAADLVDSLRMTDEAAWNASGSVDIDGHSISWIVGVATGPADPKHVLVLGTDGPMAYVILAFAKQDLEGVIRAMAGSIARAGR